MSGARSAPAAISRPRFLPILDAYLLGEFVMPFVLAFAIMYVFWAFNIYFLALKFIAQANAPFFLVLRFIVFRIPQAIPFAFPFATLAATMLGMGRLQGDNEVNAIRTNGVSLWRLCVTPLIFGFCVFLAAWAANEYIAPRSVDLSTRTFYQIVYHTASLPLDAQFFRKDPDTNNEFFVNQVLGDGRTMQGVQIFKPGRSGVWNETIQAQTAHVEGATLVLNKAILTFYNAQGYETSQTTTPEFRIGLPLGESAMQFMTNQNADAWTMNSKDLKARVSALQSQGVGGEALGNLEMNLADKLAFPFASFVSVLIALPLAFRFGKKGRGVGMGMTVLAFIVYYFMTEAASAFGSTGRVNPYVISWMPNVLFGLGGLFMLWKEDR
ncbi:MAG: LptF/LptG family permease [Candidatus Baltobacteraceae bacterium]